MIRPSSFIALALFVGMGLLSTATSAAVMVPMPILSSTTPEAGAPVVKVQFRGRCRRANRICRRRWGGGPRYRRCMRRRGCGIRRGRCWRVRRFCRAEWGGGWRYRRCVRRRGC
jgi:hypothetical protein